MARIIFAHAQRWVGRALSPARDGACAGIAQAEACATQEPTAGSTQIPRRHDFGCTAVHRQGWRRGTHECMRHVALWLAILLGLGTAAFGFPLHNPFHRKPHKPHPPVDRVLKVGDAAPDFSLPEQDGKMASLKDFRGKWLVLYFCPSDETTGCTIEPHNLERDLPEYEKAHAAVMGVSPDSPQRHKDFAAQQELTFPLVTDRKRKVAKRYGAWLRLTLILKRPARATFLVDPQGRVAKIWFAADSKNQSTEALAALNQLEKK